MTMNALSQLSVCMPYWARQRELDRSLAAYRRLYGEALEISICDDGTPTPVVAPGCIVTTLPRKTIGLNPCVPMNAAVRASTRQIVCITNPEVEHRDDVFGPMLKLLGHDRKRYIVATCHDVNGMLLAGDGTDYGAAGRMMVPEGAHFHFCALMWRDLFEQAGGFDEAYRHGRACEDNDFLWRLAEVGAEFVTCPQVVWHYRTPHRYDATGNDNRALLERKWRHRWHKPA